MSNRVNQILPEIEAKLCDGCGECIAACEPRALVLLNGKAMLAHPDRCEYDGSCEPICPQGAIQLPYVVIFGP